jgi:5-methylcytosine-specific restriction endonuclease McrA
MYISKKDRAIIKQKFDGKCAYTGTELKDDWQVEHIKPIRRNWWENSALFEKDHRIDNMVPVQRIVNHYKHSLTLEDYRERILTLHERLKKLPKNPRTDKGKKRKAYMLEVAELFGVTEDKPFSGIFYFEKNTEYDQWKK